MIIIFSEVQDPPVMDMALLVKTAVNLESIPEIYDDAAHSLNDTIQK